MFTAVGVCSPLILFVYTPAETLDEDEGREWGRQTLHFPSPPQATLATLPSDFHILCRDPSDGHVGVDRRTVVDNLSRVKKVKFIVARATRILGKIA